MSLYEHMLIWYDGPQVWLESDEHISDAWLCYQYDEDTHSQDIMIRVGRNVLKQFFTGEISFSEVLKSSTATQIRRHHGQDKDFEILPTQTHDFDGFADVRWTEAGEEEDVEAIGWLNT